MSESNQNLKYGLVIVLVAIIAAASAIVGISVLTSPPPFQPPAAEVDIQVINGETTLYLNYSTLLTLPSTEGISSYQNQFENWRGGGNYAGTTLASIVELVGGIDSNDVIRVNATDGYTQYFAHYNLYPNATSAAMQGQLILAYSFNDTTPTDWEDGPRIAFLPTDGAYSNDDANQTTHPAWFVGSAGARWVSNVASIEVLQDTYIGGSIHFTILDGTEEHTMYLVDLALMNSLEGFSAYQKQTGTWGGNGTYVGVSLLDVIKSVTSVDVNDIIRVNATDDYSQDFAYYNLYPNATFAAVQGELILAYSFNGTLPTAWSQGPRLAFLTPDGAYSNDDANQTTHISWFVGSAGARWVSNVASIEVLQDTYIGGSIHFTIIDGTEEHTMYLVDLALMDSLEGFSAYQKQTGTWGGNGTYVGVPLLDVIKSVTNVDANDIIRVNATDDYSQDFAYYNLYPNATFAAVQGELLLAYSFNDTLPTAWSQGPRLAFLTPDGAYSNDDANQTTHISWFVGSAGARWVSNVASIEVLADLYIDGYLKIIDGTEEYTVYLVDLALMDSLEGYSAYQGLSGNWRGNGTYLGVALSVILELITTIDDDDVVNVSANDGYHQLFAYYNLYPNSSIKAIQGDLILAYGYNGVIVPQWVDGLRLAFLAPDGGYSNDDASQTTHPLWYSGSGSARWVKNVCTIEIIRDSFPP